MTIEFFIPMRLPTVTLQSKQINRRTGAVHDSASLKDAKEKLDAHLAKKHAELGVQAPIEGAVALTLYLGYKADTKHLPGEPYAKKPDWDNATKLIQDSLARVGFFKDDKQVAEAHVVQHWADMPGLYIKIKEL